jgi:tetratricopeptide (TPR) repeat protein
MKVDLSPAPLDKRIVAGAFDAVALLGLCAAYFLVPVLTLGVVLPMWGVLAAIVGYAVVPLATFRQTLGFRLFGLELVGKEGHAVGLGDVLFREMIGRGWFPAAFIFNLIFGYVASYLGAARFAMPSGMQGLFFLASSLALALAVLGHLLVMTAKDRRSFADMMARSFVVPLQARAAAEDAEELADQKAARGRRIRGVVIAEVLILAFGLGTPWVLTRKTESTQQHAARLLREKLEAQFKQDPSDPMVAGDLKRALWAEGKNDEAAQVDAKFQEATRVKTEARLQAQLKHLDENPTDEPALLAVLESLDMAGKNDEAKKRYQAFVRARPEPEYRAGYADFLMNHGFEGDAVDEMKALVKDVPDFDGVHKFLAQAYVHANNLPDAQLEYQRELLLDPDDDDAREALDELDQELGPLPKAKVVAMGKELKAAQKH